MKDIKVIVMNTSKEITEVLQEVLIGEGFDTLTQFTYKFKNDEIDFDEYVSMSRPDVILYDIALPYEENYELFLELSSRKVVRDIPFILTTTNKKALEGLVGPTSTHELIGKPYDLKEIIEAVKRAAASSKLKRTATLRN